MKPKRVICAIACFFSCWTTALCEELQFVAPGTNGENPIAVTKQNIGVVATEAIVSVINELLRSRDKSEAAYRRYFGVEPEGVYTSAGDKGVSGFLAALFSLLVSGESSKEAAVKLRMKSRDLCWRLDETGDYVSYAAMLHVEGAPYKSAIILVRLEITSSNDTEKKRVSAIPSGFYVSLK
jgi:hypothetical protein